jgi:uncharacterized protein (TIGR02646 family)
LIPISRSAEPAALKNNADRWLSALKALLSDPATPKDKLKNAQNKYRHVQVKETLNKMFHGKCAYCESKINVVTYGAIEHFFPKSLYVDRTFDWDNLLLSCDRCNDTNHKGSQFPMDQNGQPLLLNPTDGVTEPDRHLEFVWDPISGLASIYGRDERGETVVTIFDLNGMRDRPELIHHRSRYLKKLLALLRLARLGDHEVISLLQEACEASSEYSAFAQAHIRPHLSKLNESFESQ